jgi:outer membrane cobalamin receptor
MRRFVALYFWVISAFAFSSEPVKVTVWGTVRDGNGQPLENVMVSMAGTTVGTMTMANGSYRLNVRPGRYKIAAMSLGYSAFEKELAVGGDTRLDIILHSANIDISQVDVLAKGKSQVVRESAYSVNSLDVRQAVQGNNSLAGIVGRSNGVNIRTEGGTGSDFDLSLNGLAGNSVRYFVDGKPMAVMGNSTNLANIPLSIIDRVEIYKGVVPVHLGSDALGGAINVITKNEHDSYIDASYGFGSFNTHRADVNGRFGIGNKGVVVKPAFAFSHSDNNYMMHNVEVWNSDTKEFENRSVRRFHDQYTSFWGGVEVGVTNRRWADELMISLNAAKTEKELQTGSIQSVVYGNATSKNESQGTGITYRKKDFLIEGLSADIYFTHTEDKKVVADTVFRKYRWDGTYIESSRNEITGRDKSLRTTRRPLNSAGATLSRHMGRSGSVVLNYSLNSVRNKRTDSYDAEFEPSDDRFSKHITGLSYSGEWIDGRLTPLIFVKNYHSRLSVSQSDLYWITGSDEVKGSSSITNWGGGAGIRWRLREAVALKLSAEHSVRLPLAREYLGNTTTIYPNFKLNPESSNNINMGLFGTIVITAQNRIGYEINGFVRDVDDYIRLKVSESDGMSQYQNVNSVNVKGVEGEVRYTFNNKLDVNANMSYLHEVNKTKYQDNGKADVTYNNRMPNRPWLFGNVDAAYSFRDIFGRGGNRLMLACDFHYVHWFYLTWKGYGALKSKSTIPTQFVAGASASYYWKKDRYAITLSSSNIFDRIVYDNYQLQKPGRTVDVKFRIFINNL